MRLAAPRLGLLRDGVDMVEDRRRTRYTVATAAVFASSIPIGVLSPSAATAVWNLVFVLVSLREWRDRRRLLASRVTDD